MRQTFTLVLCLAGCFQVAQAQDSDAGSTPVPVITSAVTNFTTGQMTIRGSAFGTVVPSVKLDGMVATVISHTVTMVVCNLPSGIAPGSYLLQLTNTSASPALSVFFAATIGATGPAGPTGPHGPIRTARAARTSRPRRSDRTARTFRRRSCRLRRGILGGLRSRVSFGLDLEQAWYEIHNCDGQSGCAMARFRSLRYQCHWRCYWSRNRSLLRGLRRGG